MKKLFETGSIARGVLIALFAVIAAASAYGRTVSISSMTRNSQGRLTANLALTTGDTNVLYVAYGATDGGSDFDAWETRRPVAMVAGDTTSYTYTFPSDKGNNVKIARFFLLEDYDHALSKRYEYILTDGAQYVKTPFTPSGRSAVEMRLSLNSVSSSVALCCARINNDTSFTAFYITGKGWRFDYFAVGTEAAPVAVADQAYALRMDSSGLYLDGSCISARTFVDKVAGGPLLIFGAKNGTGNDSVDAQYKASAKLYSMRAWSNSTDVASIALDLIPTEHEGEPCLYNKIDGTYLKSAVSGHPLGHGAEVPVTRPSVVASSDSRNISGIWYVDCVNGNDSNLGTSAALPKQTIRAATTNAASGDVIYVAPGTYGGAEGSQAISESSTVGTRVVVPEGVTLESTEGAEKTFIVGASAFGSQIDDAKYGTGANAVRCVYAKEGAIVRGFTLTGGRGVSSWVGGENDTGAAFFSSSLLGATIEDCIVSNNVALRGTIFYAVVRRCRVLGNVGRTSASGAAGTACSWYGTIIDRNESAGTVHNPYAFENCTIGDANVWAGGGANPNVLYGTAAGSMAIVNSAILGGTFSVSGGAVLYCTNCLISSTQPAWTNLPAEQTYNTIFTNSSGAQVDSEYRPVFGSFAGVDAGDAACSTDMLGDRDAFGTPRILNGALDIGAVEYDWRPAFAAELGRRFTMTYASPSVTTNATGGILLSGGGQGLPALPVCIAGTVSKAGPYAFTFTLTGGSAAVYVGDVLAGEASGTGEQSIRFNVPDVAAEIRFVFTPDAENPGEALLRKFSSALGFSIIFR